MRPGGIVAAAIMTVLMAGAAWAQSTPADPLAPGAAAEAAKDEAAKTKAAPAAAEKTDASPEKRRHEHAKPRQREGGAVAVTVHNDRSVGMIELRVGPTGEANLKKVVGPLAFGRKTLIHVPKTKECLYDIHAQFADEADTDQTSVDLCKDKAINLTD